MESGHQPRHSGARRVLLLVVLDVLVAAVVAVLVFRIFGAVSGVDTNPPQCYNSAGGVVSCALTPPVLMLPAFAAVLLGLGNWFVGAMNDSATVSSLPGRARPEPDRSVTPR